MKRAGSRGVTVVEAAFALPILLLFIFGLVDLGLWTLNANQATNAARDGARRAILDFKDLDAEGPQLEAVRAAVESRLEEDKVEDVSVRCLRGGSPISCSSARVDQDSVEVIVTWKWDLLTPVAGFFAEGGGRSTGSASMALVGRPRDPGVVRLPGGVAPPEQPLEPENPIEEEPEGPGDDTAPTECVVSSLTVTPDPIDRAANGASQQLGEPLVVTFETNGGTECEQLLIELVSTHQNPTTLTHQCPCDAVPEHPGRLTWTYRGSDNVWNHGNIWQGGEGTVRVIGGTTTVSTSFQVN